MPWRGGAAPAALSAALLVAPAISHSRGLPGEPPRKAGQGVTLSGLTVHEPVRCLEPRRPAARDVPPPPRVIDSYPAQGAVVRPGVLVLRLTFDLPMACSGALLEIPGRDQPCGGRDEQVVLSFDRKTVRIACRLEPGIRYGASLDTSSRARFVGLAGWPARPYKLEFAASGGPPVKTLQEALAEDPLWVPQSK